MKNVAKCLIIGSFRKYYEEICDIVTKLSLLNYTVLSPKKSKIIDPSKEFVVLESDVEDSDLTCVHYIEKKVLDYIREVDFIYLYSPNGYVGISTSFEVGFAYASGKMIISSNPVSDSTISEFVDHTVGINNLKNIASLIDR